MGIVERKGDIPNPAFEVLVRPPRCPKCGAPNPFGTHCQAKGK